MSDLNALIDQLITETPPVRPGGLGRTLVRATVVACVLALAGSLAMGLRPDIETAVATSFFWIKLAYGGVLSAIGLAALAMLMRPELPVPRFLVFALAPFAALLLLATREVTLLPPDEARALWLGTSWFVCPVVIAVLALPVAAALTWAVRQAAPTRLRATGATIGFAAGALAAAFYALHCPESGASFVATWYTLGIGIVTAAGAVAGPRLLRW
jgi:hypothetical protein